MLEIFERIAIAAGGLIMDVYRGEIDVSLKDDMSPVTEADQRAETFIIGELKKHFPHIAIIAEEQAAAGNLPVFKGGTFILVDPLDGTKEFINKRPYFTVNIALIEDNIPVAGVVYAPACGVAYSGAAGKAEKLTLNASGDILERVAISSRLCGEKLVAVASRSHNSPETVAFLEENDISDYKSVGSSLKFCLVAEGEADVYPRFGRTMEWDTAAGDAVLRAAGGTTLGTDGAPFVYGKRNQPHDADFANPNFICRGKV